MIRTKYTREKAYRELMLYSSQLSPLQLPEHIRVLMGAAAKILKETDPRKDQPLRPMMVREVEVTRMVNLSKYFPDWKPEYWEGREIPDLIKEVEIKKPLEEELKKAVCQAASLGMDFTPSGLKVTARVGIGTPGATTLQPVTDSEWEYAFTMGGYRDRQEQRWRK